MSPWTAESQDVTLREIMLFASNYCPTVKSNNHVISHNIAMTGHGYYSHTHLQIPALTLTCKLINSLPLEKVKPGHAVFVYSL